MKRRSGMSGAHKWVMALIILATLLILAIPSTVVLAMSSISFPAGSCPAYMAFDGDNIWVTNYSTNSVTKLRASDGSLMGTYPVGQSPHGIIFDGANMWVANSLDNNVMKLRCSDGSVVGTYNVGETPYDMTFDGVNIWVVNGAGSVSKLRASDGALVGTYSAGSSCASITYDGENIWVSNYGSAKVTKLRALDGSLVGTYSVGRGPWAMAFDGANIWVVGNSDRDVTKLRASDGSRVGTYRYGGSGMFGIAFDGANMWVSNYYDASVMKLRASDGALVGTYSAGDCPYEVAFDGADIWVANVASGTVTKFVLNSPPLTTDDSYVVGEDAVLATPAPGVLGNDTDADGDTLTAEAVALPSHGDLLLNANGSFSYTPNADYNGTDSFTYKAHDGRADSGAATVTITVTPVNDAPVLTSPGDQSSAEGDAVSLAIAAFDPDGDALNFCAAGLPADLGIDATTGVITGTLGYGSAGTCDVTVTVSDGSLSASVTFSWIISNTNRSPVAHDQAVTTAEDTGIDITLTGTDADGDALTYSVVSGPAHGVLSGSGCNLMYTPVTNYNGPDAFTFRTTDGQLDSGLGTVTVTVTPVADFDSTTLVVSLPNPSAYGQRVTLVAMVLPSGCASGMPTGTVTFLDGGMIVGTGTLSPRGLATCTTTCLSVGNHFITAVYSGDVDFNGSTSPALTQKVCKARTIVRVVSSANPSVSGRSVTLTATVVAVVPGAGMPTGTVTFRDGARVLGTGTLDDAGRAVFTTSSLGVGTHPITAVYSGDGNYSSSTSPVVSQTVKKA